MLEAAALLWLIAGDYPPSPLRDWYKSLKSPQGVPCCDISDCKPVEARTAGNDWEVAISGRWVRVPPEKVLKAKENPTGQAVACYIEHEAEAYFYCVVLPPLV